MIAGQQPSAHQGQGPSDPRLAGVTAHGEGADASRTRSWILAVAAVLVIAAVILWWRDATGDDSAAREAAAAEGIVVVPEHSDRVTVSEVEDGFAVAIALSTEPTLTGYAFSITATTAEAADGWAAIYWTPGVEARESLDPRPALVLDTGDHVWQVLITSLDGNESTQAAHAAFYELRDAIEFVPAS
ncbi:hypothetical protein [Demequina rhizosphaerae]|uniref:hypothetical protein n=1 Tax=Demequina rhizosphaerae TaxID=1638985 RepID=UPI0007826DAE|nr:hypothetical protein [Demequina rhizosphaerae]